MKTKVCSKCKVERPLSFFYKKKEAPSGLRYECKLCKRDIRVGRKVCVRKEVYLRYYAKNQIKRKAKQLVNNAIAARKMEAQGCCVCKKIYNLNIKAHAHHPDYNKPLDVIWLCPKHHKAWHRAFIAEA